MATTISRVELGFVEETAPWRLRSEYFPSKVGGKPAWLSLTDLPSPSDLKCTECGDPCSFLLQVYAPRDEQPDTFHRTLFVFICKNSFCPGLQRTGLVFRCQLPRRNAFYSFEPPPEDEAIVALSEGLPRDELCVVCGCAGPKKCSKCRSVSYCSKKHQLIHWKEQGHKEQCTLVDDSTPLEFLGSSCLLREFELVTEPEPLEENEADEVERPEEERMKDYEDFMSSTSAQTIMRFADPADLEAMAAGTDDKVFGQFKKRIECEPTQVLRFQPAGLPLWVSSLNIPCANDIPPCPDCGAARTFEFQVMPQLLNYLGLDRLESSSLDFGTLAVYTCSTSCSQGSVYKTEFLWTQHIS